MDVSSQSYLKFILEIYFVIYSYGLTICSGSTLPSSISKTEPALLIVSYDAFRPEYFNRSVTPFMNAFRKEGTSASFVYNVFPTKTFVNHHTIATGLYPKTHGVLANIVYDTKLGPLNYGYDLFHYDESILPIWTANEKSGKHSGCMMWPGSDFKYDDISCTFTTKFNTAEPWENRVDTVMSWFTNKKTPANLVMLYIEEPDAHGHIYSPDSNVITKMVAKLDDLTKYIQQKLVDNKLEKRVNVIHLSDHGMNSVSPPNFIDLTKFIANGTYTMYGTSPVLQIVPIDKAKENEIFVNLTKAAKENGHFNIYNHENLPERWNANNARRLGPILAVADIKYAFQDMFESAEYYKKAFNVPITPTTKYGAHGYDNMEETMHAIFMAKGPLFASGKILKPFNTVDLYNLFCLILKIRCNRNEGADRSDAWNVLLDTQSPPDNDRKTGKLQYIADFIRDRIRYFTKPPIIIYFTMCLLIVSAALAIGLIYVCYRNRYQNDKKGLRILIVDEPGPEGELLLNSDAEE